MYGSIYSSLSLVYGWAVGLGELTFRSCYTKECLVQLCCSCGHRCDTNVQKISQPLFSLLSLFLNKSSGENQLPAFLWYETDRIKTTPTTIICCRGNVFSELLPSNGRGIYEYTQTHRFSFEKIRTAYKITRSTILSLLRVFIAAGTCLPSCCVAPNGGIHLTEPLACNDRRDIYMLGGVTHILV
jgi:hypothetical protein